MAFDHSAWILRDLAALAGYLVLVWLAAAAVLPRA